MSQGKRFATGEIDVAKHDRHAEQIAKRRAKRREKQKRTHKIPGWVYKIILILILSVVGMLLWFNRQNLAPDRVMEWAQDRVVGIGVGDGFPQPIAGTVVEPKNFLSVNKELVVVSDTDLSIYNSTAKVLASRQHSFSEPVMKTNGSRTLIYNLGGTGYQVESRTKTVEKKNTEGNIFAGALSEDGHYAFATQAEGYCGELTAYKPDGTAKFQYWFADYYPTSVALDPSGSHAAVTAISALDGGLTSAVYLLDLSTEGAVEPFAAYTENMMLDSYWSADGTVSAIGDKMTAVINTATQTKVNYDYQGMQLSAYTVDSGRTVLSLTAFDSATSSRLVVLGGDGKELANISVPGETRSVSLYGDTVAALAGGTIYAYSAVGGNPIATVDAGGDAKAVALASESEAYVLGISELRYVELAAF
ncbi:MAG: hypothetical protein KHW69_06095 [Clostridium sp.]|nr:hypothetical protein [Clostridium sp.]